LPERDLHESFKAMLTHRYFIRAHMAVMLGLVGIAGILASRILVAMGMRSMALRYPIAVAVSYLVFFGLVRMWLAYIARVSRARRGATSSLDPGSFVPDGPFSFSGGTAKAATGFAEGGGKFGGAGASLNFGEAAGEGAPSPMAPAIAAAAPRSTTTRSSSGGSFSLDLDGDGVLLLILFILLVCGILGAGAFLVYQAPAVLSEAAFQAILASGLARTARNAHDPGWPKSVFKATVLPFAIVLVLAGVFGIEASKRCPSATTVRQVFRTCIFRN